MQTVVWWMTMVAAGAAWSLVVAGGAVGGGCEIAGPSAGQWRADGTLGLVPPLDRDRPARTETAVFGLG